MATFNASHASIGASASAVATASAASTSAAKAAAAARLDGQYKMLSQREHILTLPDTYVGSVDAEVVSRWVWDTSTGRMVWRPVEFCPAMLRVFDEILVNALDHRVRLKSRAAAAAAAAAAAGAPSPPLSDAVTRIDVSLTPTRLAVRNNGEGVPIDEHPTHKMPVVQLIFGNLLTSTNYDQSEEKVIGGKNGFGAKLTSIYSSVFTVETVAPTPGKPDKRSVYTQEWRSNMSVCGKPIVRATAAKPYTDISWTLDTARFRWVPGSPSAAAAALGEVPPDMLAVMATRVVDAAMCCGAGCKVYLNGALLDANSLVKYVTLFIPRSPVAAPAKEDDDDGAGVVVDNDDDVDDDGDGDEGRSRGGSRSRSSVGGTSVAAPGATGATGATATTVAARERSLATTHIAYEQAGVRWEVAAVLTSVLYGDGARVTIPDDRHVTFVNGINTSRGGTHLTFVARTVLAAFCEVATKRLKADVAPPLLKESLTFFIVATVANPSFSSQAKSELTSPVAKWGSRPDFLPATDKRGLVAGLLRIGLLGEADALLSARLSRDAKRTDGSKRSKLSGIPKLTDARWAGTAKSAKCTLILTEGDSAASSALAGIAATGRDFYGAFPLKGKVLNVKDAAADKKAQNTEIATIKRVLGLRDKEVYTDLTKLRYGRVMIMTDQDVDGSHIKGLLMNLFACEWPSLLELGFLCSLATPLLKATPRPSAGAAATAAGALNFYSEPEFERWLAAFPGGGAAATRAFTVKYYKGLGTSSAKEMREYFADMSLVRYDWDASAGAALDLAFNKRRADDRKAWLTERYDPGRILAVTKGESHVTYDRFVHDELMHYSVASNERALPRVEDGLKPSQRKIVWACLRRSLTRELKVAQLAGHVAEVSAYAHGEVSLAAAIVGLAQNFVGSNNVNVLEPHGQFGTRVLGGKDAAATRYIFTHLDPVARLLLPKPDDAVLAYVQEEGTTVEPEAYLPTLPLLLVNGCVGIGTGFSTCVLPHNPKDLIVALRARLTGSAPSLERWQLRPWWRGFTGGVEPSRVAASGPHGTPRVWTVTGRWAFADDDKCTVRITELPAGVWSRDYKKMLDEALELASAGVQSKRAKTGATKATSSKTTNTKPKRATPGAASVAAATALTAPGASASAAAAATAAAAHDDDPATAIARGLLEVDDDLTDERAAFTLRFTEDAYHTARAYPAAFVARFGLAVSVSETNMMTFDVDGRIRKFETPGELLERYYGARLDGYARRRTAELARLDAELVEARAKLTFVRAVISGQLVVANAADADLLAGLLALDLPPLSAKSVAPAATADNDETSAAAETGGPSEQEGGERGGPTLRGFEYLLRMRVDRIKAAAIMELEAQAAACVAARDTMAAQTPQALWLADLAALEAGLEDHEARRLATLAASDGARTSKAPVAGGKRKR